MEIDHTAFILERIDKRGLCWKSYSYHGKGGTISSSPVDLFGWVHAQVQLISKVLATAAKDCVIIKVE
jgi:hypothetical protein